MNALRRHVREEHPRLNSRRRLVQLALDHATDHHRYLPNHRHAGVNLGPDSRPPGWRTGLDVEPIR